MMKKAIKDSASPRATAPAQKAERLSRPGMEKEIKAVTAFLKSAMLDAPFRLTDDDGEDFAALGVGSVWYDLQGTLMVGFTCRGDLEPDDHLPGMLAKKAMELLVNAKPRLVAGGVETELSKV